MIPPRRLLGAALLSLVGSHALACSSHTAPSPPPPPSSPRPPPAAGDPAIVPAPPASAPTAAERFIVAEADAAKFYVGHYEPPTSYFTPTEADVAAFEQGLPAFLAGIGDADARAIGERLTTYRRQFVGVVRAEGTLVFVNYFCDTDIPATVPAMVDDGGSCYFNVFYEPQRRAFMRLSINGDG